MAVRTATFMNSMTKSGSRIVFKFLVIAAIFMGTILPTNVANAGVIFPSTIPALGLLIEENIDKRSLKSYGPKSTGKKMILFIDDLNMPNIDKYGT
jgi:hypothetical protein